MSICVYVDGQIHAPAEATVPVLDRGFLFGDSAVRGILPVTAVDGRRVGAGRPGPVTRRLLDLYQQLVSEAR
jgi:branched-subunit amino acid aminotransferase/4-amino-4-deoxychorismate lyase